VRSAFRHRALTGQLAGDVRHRSPNRGPGDRGNFGAGSGGRSHRIECPACGVLIGVRPDDMQGEVAGLPIVNNEFPQPLWAAFQDPDDVAASAYFGQYALMLTPTK
jgi:hypothetical protein